MISNEERHNLEIRIVDASGAFRRKRAVQFFCVLIIETLNKITWKLYCVCVFKDQSNACNRLTEKFGLSTFFDVSKVIDKRSWISNNLNWVYRFGGSSTGLRWRLWLAQFHVHWSQASRPRLVLEWVIVREDQALWTWVRSSLWTLICDRPSIIGFVFDFRPI